MGRLTARGRVEAAVGGRGAGGRALDGAGGGGWGGGALRLARAEQPEPEVGALVPRALLARQRPCGVGGEEVDDAFASAAAVDEDARAGWVARRGWLWELDEALFSDVRWLVRARPDRLADLDFVCENIDDLPTAYRIKHDEVCPVHIEQEAGMPNATSAVSPPADAAEVSPQ